MRVHYKAIESYGSVRVDSGVVDANAAQLILMLFDGLVENILDARRHMQQGHVAEKSRHIARAARIVIGLQSALNFELGGELALNLDDLYSYFIRRLTHANVHNDVAALDEVYGLTGEVRQAWTTLPFMQSPTRQ